MIDSDDDTPTQPEIPSRRATPTPQQQLEWLEEAPHRYRDLVEREGIACAAHSIAVWRLAAAGYAAPVPRRTDLNSAAATLKRRLELDAVPSGRALVSECRAAGRRVID